MADLAFGSHREVIVLARLSPHHEASTPACAKKPELCTTVDELQTRNLLLTAHEVVQVPATFQIDYLRFSLACSDGKVLVRIVHCRSSDAAQHQDSVTQDCD